MLVPRPSKPSQHPAASAVCPYGGTDYPGNQSAVPPVAWHKQRTNGPYPPVRYSTVPNTPSAECWAKAVSGSPIKAHTKLSSVWWPSRNCSPKMQYVGAPVGTHKQTRGFPPRTGEHSTGSPTGSQAQFAAHHRGARHLPGEWYRLHRHGLPARRNITGPH